jgi:hypothetical protein
MARMMGKSKDRNTVCVYGCCDSFGRWTSKRMKKCGRKMMRTQEKRNWKKEL